MTPGFERLAGKVVLVTSSSSGAGVSIARAFARQAAKVAVHCRSATRDAEAVVAGIAKDGGTAAAFTADLAQDGAPQTLAAEVAHALGPIAVLVNNAGPFADAPFRSLEPAVWDRVMAVNLKAPYLLVQQVAPAMERAGWGRIVNIGATSSLVRSHSVYGLAKAALSHLTESLALELAPTITVNALVPSQIASARTDTMPVYKDAAIAGTPLGRLVTEDEIGEMAVLLCSPAFDFVTGRAIVMDGGRTLPRFPRIGLGS
jgi:3-oxoacyl-[acyl-carrier protein] reductase/7-alpha-hydroxysteroid dehydrogenase/pteridine reductase